MSKCQLYAKGKKIYPITKCENIIMNDGSSLSSQLDTKASKSETQNIQQQINNLVLESGGDSNLEVVQARGRFNTLNDRLNINDDINKLNISKTKLVQNVKLQHCIKNDGAVTPVSPSYALTYYDVTNLEYIYIEGNLNVPNGAYSDYLFKDVNGNVLEHQGKKNSNLSNIFKVPTGATILYLGTGASDYMHMSVYNINNMQDIIEDLKINSLNRMDNSTLEAFNKSSYMEKLTPVIYNQSCVKNNGTITPVTPTYTSLEFDVQNESYIYVKNLNVSAPNRDYCYYVIINENNEVLESVTGSNEILNKLIYLPNNSYKIRFTCLTSNYSEGNVLVYKNITDVINTRSTHEYVDNSINNLNNLYEVENLFDKYSDEVVLGYSLGSDGILYENANLFVTNYIPVTMNDTIYANFINGAYYVCYNSEKKRIGYGYLSSGISGCSKISELTTVNSDNLPAIAYIRFSNPITNFDKLTVNLAPVYKSQAHKVLPIKHLQCANNGLINFWEGKTGDSLGDSLTGQGFFQKYTSMYFNLKRFANHGVGGSKLSGANVDSSRPSMWQDSRINALRDDADFITILGGQNDGNVEIGEVSKANVDTNTYVGAYNTIIDKIYKKYNGNIQIILCTPFYVPSDGDNGERFIKLDKAVKEIGQLHGLPVADFGGMSGANKYVKDVYWTSSDYTHPVESFYRDKITPILIETMQKVKPIDFEKINSVNYGISQ